MVAKVFKSVSDVIDNYSGLSRKVLEYSLTVKDLADKCKHPDFDHQLWDDLFSQYFAKDNFLRVGHLKEEMDYPTYIKFQTKWAPISEWECSFKRISQVDNVVFMELEERASVQGFTNIVNTISVYEFNDEEKIQFLDVYLQQTPLPTDDIPDAYK